MLSPWTKPGTKVVVLADTSGRILPVIRAGEVYTLAGFTPAYEHSTTGNGFGVLLEEISHPNAWGPFVWSYDGIRFRPAELPRVLTDILIAVDIVAKERA